ncbi:MAG TPA: amidohydrolase family protein [Candidatus Thermoplasmatota archaeon]
MSKHSVLILTFVALTATGAAAAPPEPLVLTNANVVDVRAGSVRPGVTLVLRNGRIESLSPASAPAGVNTVDLRGRYVLPGLVDAHTHISTFAAARQALESGVTTVRSSGVSYYFDVGFHELVKKGGLPGPDMVASGYHVRPRVADEAFVSHPALFELMSGIDTVGEIRALVRANLSQGVEWIKVLATERAGTADTDPRKQVYTEAELRAAVEEAATRGIPVQAHAHGEEGALAAVRAGVRSIEHGTYLSDETLALMKEKGTYFVPTYTTVVDLTQPGGDYDVPALRLRGAHMLPRLRQSVERAHRLGVKIVAGADTSYGPGSLTRIAGEVVSFVELGQSPAEALRTATTTAAEMLGKERAIGAVEAGFEADLLAVEGNPLENPGALLDPLLVVSNGQVVVNRLEFARAK